jgi:hypothetical protein
MNLLNVSTLLYHSVGGSDVDEGNAMPKQNAKIFCQLDSFQDMTLP